MVPIPIMTAWTFLRNSWIGKLLAAIVGLLLLRAYWKHQGGSEAKEYINRKSEEAAMEREVTRNEIDNRIASGGNAADRLRDDWSRD